MTIKEHALTLFDDYKELTVKELAAKTNASKQMIHHVLNELLSKRMIQKLGRTPKTSYRLVEIEDLSQDVKVPHLKEQESLLLNDLFLMVDETGNLLKGAPAFALWCAQRGLSFQKTLDEFDSTLQNYKGLYDEHGNINGTEKLLNTKGYDKIWIDNLYYLDLYEIEKFGRTPLGTLLHYAKQGQSVYLMKLLMAEIKTRIHEFVKQQKADAIAFVPPTIKRETQFMKFLQSNLNLSLPIVEIKKVSGLIPIPQKSLPKLDERIRNAENTFAVTDPRKFKHVILIDDAVESGATVNQIAGKIKLKGIAAEVTGLALVGSFEGFEVVSEM
ncbi:MAG: hypothetical protein SGJ15_11660 [Bacteroidota bacterium]|nr:hypothetical protein [Bacteroidota bacterium]